MAIYFTISGEHKHQEKIHFLKKSTLAERLLFQRNFRLKAVSIVIRI